MSRELSPDSRSDPRPRSNLASSSRIGTQTTTFLGSRDSMRISSSHEWDARFLRAGVASHVQTGDSRSWETSGLVVCGAATTNNRVAAFPRSHSIHSRIEREGWRRPWALVAGREPGQNHHQLSLRELSSRIWADGGSFASSRDSIALRWPRCPAPSRSSWRSARDCCYPMRSAHPDRNNGGSACDLIGAIAQINANCGSGAGHMKRALTPSWPNVSILAERSAAQRRRATTQHEVSCCVDRGRR